ncbi:hypothetical protein KUCAC02_008974, partial [Chaenocephalus aceratus]
FYHSAVRDTLSTARLQLTIRPISSFPALLTNHLISHLSLISTYLSTCTSTLLGFK